MFVRAVLEVGIKMKSIAILVKVVDLVLMGTCQEEAPASLVTQENINVRQRILIHTIVVVNIVQQVMKHHKQRQLNVHSVLRVHTTIR